MEGPSVVSSNLSRVIVTWDPNPPSLNRMSNMTESITFLQLGYFCYDEMFCEQNFEKINAVAYCVSG